MLLLIPVAPMLRDLAYDNAANTKGGPLYARIVAVCDRIIVWAEGEPIPVHSVDLSFGEAEVDALADAMLRDLVVLAVEASAPAWTSEGTVWARKDYFRATPDGARQAQALAWALASNNGGRARVAAISGLGAYVSAPIGLGLLMRGPGVCKIWHADDEPPASVEAQPPVGYLSHRLGLVTIPE